MVQASTKDSVLISASELGEPTALQVAAVRSAWRRRQRLVWTLRIGVPLVFLLLWELAARQAVVDPLFTGQPSAIFHELRLQLVQQVTWQAAGMTVWETTAGFVIGATAGVVCGVVFYLLPIIRDALQPTVSALNSTPRIALAPLFVLWFGLGALSKIVLAVSLVFFVLLANTLAGLQSADRDHLLLGRSLGVSRTKALRLFVLPSALPSVFAGLQLGLVYSFLGVVAGEMLGGTTGLGARMAFYTGTFQTNAFFAALLVLLVVAIALSQVMYRLERRLLTWKRIEMAGTM